MSRSPSLVGFSSGGAIALDYALDHPQSVDRLVVVGGGIDLPPSATSRRREDRNFFPILFGNDQAVAANWAKDPWYIAHGDDAAKAKALAIWKTNRQNIRHLPVDPALRRPPTLPRLPELRVPTLFIVGDRDFPEVLTTADTAQARIPNAERVTMANAGHALQLERSQETADLIVEFVRGADGATTAAMTFP
jgi:3-oxoadipate enol-lactonase